MRNVIVVDTSVVIKWILEEADSAKAKALLTEWIDKETSILAPALLAYEVANVLYQKVRKGEIVLEVAKETLTEILLSELDINFLHDPVLSLRAVELAHKYGLQASYDVHYLALAEHEGCELWTSDTRMWRAIGGKIAWLRRLEDYHASPEDHETT